MEITKTVYVSTIEFSRIVEKAFAMASEMSQEIVSFKAEVPNDKRRIFEYRGVRYIEEI